MLLAGLSTAAAQAGGVGAGGTAAGSVASGGAPPRADREAGPVAAGPALLDLVGRVEAEPWELDRALILPLQAGGDAGRRAFRLVVEARGSTRVAVIAPRAGGPGAAGRLSSQREALSQGVEVCQIPAPSTSAAAGRWSAEVARAGAPELDTPQPHAALGPSLVVRGRARGTWFAEAVFPVHLLGPEGSALASGVARAQGSWMTEGYVPFRAELRIDGPVPGRAMLVLERANPSGLARNAGFLVLRLGCG